MATAARAYPPLGSWRPIRQQRVHGPLGGDRSAGSLPAAANPYDNAKAESFFKTLKRAEVYLKDYQTFADADAILGQFIEAVHNTKRLRSSPGYLPQAEFEATYGHQ